MRFSQLDVSGSAPGGQVRGVDSHGHEGTFHISSYKGRFLALVFYHADWDCLEYLEAFADIGDKFKSARAEVVFCSTDSPKVHACWLKTERCDGGFGGELAGKISGVWSDPAGDLSSQYDLYDEEENECLDGVVIIDEDGLVRHAMTTSLDFHDTANSTLELVKMLKAYSVDEKEVTKEAAKKVSSVAVSLPVAKKVDPKHMDWDVSKDQDLLKVVDIAKKLGRPAPPHFIYCPKNPVFDLIPAKIRRLVNPKASVVSCSASLYRSVVGFEGSQSLELESTMKNVLEAVCQTGDINGTFSSLSRLNPQDRATVLDSEIIQLTNMESYPVWSEGQGVFVNNFKNLAAWINVDGQFHLVSAAKGQDIKYVLLRLQKAIMTIETAMKTCELHGFQTSNGGFVHNKSGLLGTGFQVQFSLQLAGFENAGNAELEKAQTDLGLSIIHSVRKNIFLVEIVQRPEDRELDIVTRSVDALDKLWRMDMELQSKLGLRR